MKKTVDNSNSRSFWNCLKSMDDSVQEPQNWCDGLIIPIFKTGSKTDPSNYRGICISSCLGKLFCSILNQRLLEHVQFCTSCYKSMSEEKFIKLSKVYTQILRVLLELEKVKRDLFNTVEV